MNSEIIIVSGLPRSGTSLMMQMLRAGGIEVVTDEIRAADTDNPRGYCEFEKVKKTKEDPSWVPEARGKAVKLVSSLLYDLPDNENYRIVFMERDFDEMLQSQEKMLARLNRAAAPRDQMKKSFTIHLEKLRDWLKKKRNMAMMCVSYAEVVEHPDEQARRVSEFLGGAVNAQKMVEAVDPSLYRNKKSKGATCGSGSPA